MAVATATAFRRVYPSNMGILFHQEWRVYPSKCGFDLSNWFCLKLGDGPPIYGPLNEEHDDKRINQHFFFFVNTCKNQPYVMVGGLAKPAETPTSRLRQCGLAPESLLTIFETG